MKKLVLLMIALLPFAGCDLLDNGSGNKENQGQGGEQGGGGNGGGSAQSGDGFTYEVAATQPSGAIKKYTKDLWLDRTHSAGFYQFMVVETKLAYDSKGRIAKEETTTTYYTENDNGNVEQNGVVHDTRYRVYDDKAGKMEIRTVQDKASSAIFKGELDASGKLSRGEVGGYNGSTWTARVMEFDYTDGGLLSKVTYPDQTAWYPFEFSWNTSAPYISSIQEKDPRATSDPEEDESRNYVYTSTVNPTFGAALDIAFLATYAHVIGLDYSLPLGKGSKNLVDYANTTYRNEAEKFTYEWESGKLSHIKLVQKLFPDDAGVKNERQRNFWPEYYD